MHTERTKFVFCRRAACNDNNNNNAYKSISSFHAAKIHYHK